MDIVMQHYIRFVAAINKVTQMTPKRFGVEELNLIVQGHRDWPDIVFSRQYLHKTAINALFSS